MPKTSHLPSISVLVPVYNVENYLRQCLDSLQNQTFKDFEIICINDGSTDASREIIQEFINKDSRFSVIDKNNSGYGASMNRGLKKAQGKYIAILESDDFFEPFALEKLYEAAEKYNAQVVKADFWLYWSQPKEHKKAFGIIAKKMADRLVDPQVEHDIFYKKPSIWSGMYQREWLEQSNIDFLETPGASYQDAAFNFKVWASAERAVFLTAPILFYRQDNEQSSVNSPTKVFCVCDEYAEMDRYLKKNPEKYERLKYVKQRMKINSYLWNYDRLSPELRKQFLIRMTEEFKADEQAGLFDWSALEYFEEVNVRAILNSPEAFVEGREKLAKPGKLNTFKHYYHLGGWPLVKKVLVAKAQKGE